MVFHFPCNLFYQGSQKLTGQWQLVRVWRAFFPDAYTSTYIWQAKHALYHTAFLLIQVRLELETIRMIFSKCEML